MNPQILDIWSVHRALTMDGPCDLLSALHKVAKKEGEGDTLRLCCFRNLKAHQHCSEFSWRPASMPALIRKRGVGVCDGASRDSSCFFEKDNMTTHLHKLSWTCILQLQFQRSAPQVDCKSVVGCSRPPTAWPAMLCFYLHTKPITASGTFCQLHQKNMPSILIGCGSDAPLQLPPQPLAQPAN